MKEAGNVKVSASADAAEVYQRYREHIVQQIQKLQPDIFLVINGYAIEAEFPGFFAQIKSLGITMVTWHADDPYYVDLQQPIAGCFDYIFTVDSSTVDLWRASARHAAQNAGSEGNALAHGVSRSSGFGLDLNLLGSVVEQSDADVASGP